MKAHVIEIYNAIGGAQHTAKKPDDCRGAAELQAYSQAAMSGEIAVVGAVVARPVDPDTGPKYSDAEKMEYLRDLITRVQTELVRLRDLVGDDATHASPVENLIPIKRVEHAPPSSSSSLVVVVVVCADCEAFKGLPVAIDYNGTRYGRSGWNSDRFEAYFRNDVTQYGERVNAK